MKKILCLLVLIISSYIQAQDVIFTTSQKDYIPCEIILNNGSILNGYIKDFTLPKTVEFRTPAYSFKAIESKLNLDKTTFKFKNNLSEKDQKLSLENIHSIALKDSDATTYEKLKLKTINSNMEVVDLEREIMIPLIREDKISLYGLKVFNCFNGNNCEMMYVIAYIKNQNQDFAYIPIDVNRINLLNFSNADDKFLKSFEEAGSDCPEFLAYMEEKRVSFADKDFRKAYKENYKTFQKEKKAKLKLIKGLKNKEKAEDEMDSDFFLKMYTEVIEEYSSRCDD